MLATPTAASATDSLCHPAHTAGACGQIRNTGSTAFTVATNYVSASSATGVKLSLSAGKDTLQSSFRTASGDARDWDAFWIPGGSCAKINSGVAAAFVSYDNRVGKAGVWHKVDNLGANVKVKSGSCP